MLAAERRDQPPPREDALRSKTFCGRALAGGRGIVLRRARDGEGDERGEEGQKRRKLSHAPIYNARRAPRSWRMLE